MITVWLLQSTVVDSPKLLRLLPGWFVSSTEARSFFFVEGESECTSERARGQFSIFGAVEEMFATDFHGSARIKELFQECGCKAHGGLGFCLTECVGGKVLENNETDCAQGVHRKCRKAVASCQLPVASFQSAVFSSRSRCRNFASLRLGDDCGGLSCCREDQKAPLRGAFCHPCLSSSVVDSARFASRDSRGGCLHMSLADDRKDQKQRSKAVGQECPTHTSNPH